MILSYAKKMKLEGYDYSRNLVVDAWDIDRNCVFMTYIQLSLYDIPAKVICGNALALEEEFILYTPEYYIFNELLQKRKNNVPICSFCKEEIKGKIQKSKINLEFNLCQQCWIREKRIIDLVDILKNFE